MSFYCKITERVLIIMHFANITRRLIGQRQEIATVYSAICRRKRAVTSKVAWNWSSKWSYVAHVANVFVVNTLFFDV